MAGALTRDTALFSFASAADLTDKEGYAVEVESGKVELWDGTGTLFGVVVDGDTTSGRNTVATFAGASGTVKVKLNGTVSAGNLLEIESGGTFIAQSSNDAYAMAIEDGVADELIEAALCMYEV
jgi:hypothetical protein